MLCALKVVQSIVTGNTVIAKPSPFTPYTALKLCEVAQKALPPGVFQVLGGSDMLGPWIVDHPKIPKISFTGSVATGRRVQIAGAKYLKKVSLELLVSFSLHLQSYPSSFSLQTLQILNYKRQRRKRPNDNLPRHRHPKSS